MITLSLSIVSVKAQTVDTFSIRIADFMPVRVTQPDMDNPVGWQEALDDLAAAAPNGEITHVQLRGYWHCRYNSGVLGEPTPEEWETPMLGSTDAPQTEVMQNWRSWYFCNPRPQGGIGLCAIERIRNAGFKVEIGLSLAYRIEPNVPPAMRRYQRERNHPNWNGSEFIENYWNNALKPFAEEAAPWLEAGDIFFIGFENYQENIDHLQLHSAEYSNMIAQLRTILPPGVLISDHTSSWYVGSGEEDSFLGLNQDGTIRTEGGLLNHYYFADLDLLEMSNWNPWVTTSQLPTDRNEVAQGHFNNPNACQRGTGYGGVPCVTGRNIMDDFQRIYDEFGTPILMNTGYQNCYGQAASNVGSCLGGRDENEQAEAWAGRLLALKMAIEEGYTWVAGQDFERYCEDISGDYTTYPVASWRNRPAQDEIINGINDILNQTPSTTSSTTTSSTTTTTTTTPPGQVTISGQLTNGTGPIEANIIIYNQGTDGLNASQISLNGDYNLGVWPDVYDLQYNILEFFIPNFWIKLMSLSITSNLQNVVNSVTGYSSDNVTFTVNITTDQEIQIYSEGEPQTVKANGIQLTKATTLPLNLYEWTYVPVEQKIRMIINSSIGTTTSTTTTSTSTTTTSSTTIPDTKTFGNNDTSGTTGTLLSDYLSGVYYTAPEDGVVTSMTAYIQTPSPIDIGCALYDDAGPDLLIESTSVNTVTSPEYAWITFNFPAGQEPSIMGGQDYIFTCWSDGNANLRYQNETGRSRYRSVGSLTFPNWPDPESFNAGDRRHAIHVTYT